MPRRARAVFAGIPHHVTQRGNHREQVFFTKGDRETYLALLREYSAKHSIDVLAYCLMTNHVHLVIVPKTSDALQRALKPLHARYAQRVNRMRQQKGHLWQGRYYSSALDAQFRLAAIRYVELNPVRAGIVSKAEDYAWSSAAAHCGLFRDPLLCTSSRAAGQVPEASEWSAWLAVGDDPEGLQTLRLHASMNLPCGGPKFIEMLETSAGRTLRYRPQGGQARGSR